LEGPTKKRPEKKERVGGRGPVPWKHSRKSEGFEKEAARGENVKQGHGGPFLQQLGPGREGKQRLVPPENECGGTCFGSQKTAKRGKKMFRAQAGDQKEECLQARLKKKNQRENRRNYGPIGKNPA